MIIKEKEVILEDDDIIAASQDKSNDDLLLSDFKLDMYTVHSADRVVFRPQIGGPDIVFKDRKNPLSVKH